MRVLNIMLAQVRGGVESMALRYHQALRAAGTPVLSLGHSEGTLAQLPVGQFRKVNAIVNHDPFAALAIRQAAREFRPDLILTHGNRATGICLLPFLDTAAKTVQVVHNFRHKSQVDRARAAIAVSQAVYDSFRIGHPALPCFEVDNFAPLDVRPVKPAPVGIPTLGTLGRLHVNKGLDIAVRAVGLLKARGVSVRLRIAGDGPELVALTQVIKSAGVADFVDFAGWVDETANYLANLDLFLLPSRVEPFGLVVTEAMAAGTPVVAAAIDGPKEILQDGALGFFCAPEDPESLAQAIEAALSDWPVTLDKARAAQAHALESYSLEAGKTRLTEVLAQIAQIPADRA